MLQVEVRGRIEGEVGSFLYTQLDGWRMNIRLTFFGIGVLGLKARSNTKLKRFQLGTRFHVFLHTSGTFS